MVLSPLIGDIAKKIGEIDVKKLKNDYLSTFKIDVSKYLDHTKLVEIYQDKTGYAFYYPTSCAGDSNFYEQLEKYDWYYMDWKWEHEEALKYIEAHDKVLEIGCARGTFIECLTKRGNTAIGLELNKKALKEAKSKKLNVVGETIENFAKKNSGKYDVVCSFQVMEHIPNIGEVIESSLKTLKKGGKLIVSVPNNDNPVFKYGNIPLNKPPHHIGLWTADSLKEMATFFDLKLIGIKIEPLQSYHVNLYIDSVMNMFLINSHLKRLIYRMTKGLFKLFSKKIKGLTIMAIYEK